MNARLVFLLLLVAGCGAELQTGAAPSAGAVARQRGPDDDLPPRTATKVAPATAIATHTVAPGETMWRIARNFGTTAPDLAKYNGIADPTAVRAGTVLKIPPKVGDEDVADKPTGRVLVSSRYPLRWPIDGAITSRFGQREGKTHDGIDISARLGTQVLAAANGRVVFSARHGGYGNLVVLRHDDGLVTVYAHHSINLVRKGDSVQAGQVIAKVGDSGRTSGPHLHFEVRKGIAPQNPLRFLPP